MEWRRKHDGGYAWDWFYPGDEGWPDEPFWNMVLDFTGRHVPYLKFMEGTYYGYGTFQEWVVQINANPKQWTMAGHPGSFMIERIK
jgi:hypothetical protein